jgi:hypothetical protein
MNVEVGLITKRKTWLLSYLGLIILYGFVGYDSSGYDDEFINIRLIGRYGIEVIGIIRNADVHPAGSYLVDWVLFAILEDWHLVRLAVALGGAAVLVYAIDTVRESHGAWSGVIAIALVGLNPALLMWCTSLRWYAFFVPILVWLSVTPKLYDWRYWGKCFGGLVLLGYFSYAVFVLAIPLLVLYWRDCPNSTRSKIRSMVFFGGIIGILYLYQMMIFVTVHLHQQDGQTSSLAKSLMGFAVAQIGNQGLFPLSLAGGLSAIGMLGMLFLVLRFSLIENLRFNHYFLPYWLGVAGLVFTGLAGKFRNFVIVSPWQGLWIATARIEDSKKSLFRLFLFLVIVGNLVGIYNVVYHRDTTKNSWNLPVPEVVAAVEAESSTCDQDLLVLTHDPTFSYILEHSGVRVLGPYASRSVGREMLQRPHRCVMVIKTYAGNLHDRLIADLYSDLEFLTDQEMSIQRFGYDRFHRLKQRLEPRYPEYQVEVITYREVNNLMSLEHWNTGRRQP